MLQDISAENREFMQSVSEETIVKNALELLSVLVAPSKTNQDAVADNSSNVKDLDDALELNLTIVESSKQYRDLWAANHEVFIFPTSNNSANSRWKFACTCLQLMKLIHDTFAKSCDEKLKLLSVSQKKLLEKSLEFIISLGLLPYLLPCVGISLAAKCKTVTVIKPENINDFTKYRRLCSLIDALFYLKDVDVFHDLIVSKHLEDLLAALFQLSFAPIKKPNSCDKNEPAIDLNSFDDKFKIEKMTYPIWRRLNEDKRKYREYLEIVLQKTYKPLLIQKLMILSSKETPRWMKQNLTKMLADIVLDNNGILAVTKAVIETDNEAPIQWSHCMTVAKLISNIFCSNSEDNAERLATQILTIMKIEYNRADDFTIARVAALTISVMFSKCPQMTEKLILNKILRPFVSPEPYVNEIDEFIVRLFNLYVFTNDLFAIPTRVMLPISRILYSLYCYIRDKNCRSETMIKELLVILIRGVDGNSLMTLIDCFIFDEKHESVMSLPEKITYVVSPTNGVRVVQTDNHLRLLDHASIFLELVDNMTENEHIIRTMFLFLLKKFVSIHGSQDATKKRCIIAKLLSDMSEKSTTLKYILKNPHDIIQFVNELLKMPSKDGEYDEIIRICLTFLTMIFYDLRKKKQIDWEIFSSLLPSLEKHKNHSSIDVQILAQEALNLIRTRGLIGNMNTRNGNIDSIEKPAQSKCEKNIEAACDELLPIRAHALAELISLIKKGDAETLAKKEKILCLFQENLKDQESFLYLRAIEGISCMATLKPDIVLPLLCEEFVTCTSHSTQLKIGEILVRTTKSLNDFIFSYKALLLNTFLTGVKSEDSLIRASSLSNLAEVCLLLGSQVEDSLYEILLCIQNIALHDKEVEPRRASVLFMASLLEGLKSSMITVLEDRILEIYRTLKRIYSTDEDYVVRLQAQLSLDVLNENMKDILTSKPTLEKKIRVLDTF